MRALPMNVPSLIEVDISGLTEVDQTIRVGDFAKFLQNVTLVTHVEDPVVKITAMRVVEEEEVAAEEAAEAEAAEAAEDAEGEETPLPPRRKLESLLQTIRSGRLSIWQPPLPSLNPAIPLQPFRTARRRSR